LLILRVCNLQVAWVGLYVRFADLAKAAADLEKFPDQQLIDFSFPQVPGFYLHHDLLEYGVRQTGVVWLDTPPAAENLEAVIREYLEILSKIPGVMATPMPAGGCEGVSSEEVREALQLPERGGSCALNLALRKPACQSSVSRYSLGATPGEDARGGNNGHTSGRYGFHTATERDPWWQVDLEDVFLLRRVVIFNRREQAERLKRFTLLGSRDGRDWEELFRKTDDRVFGSSGEPFTAEIDGERLARFVRVRLDGEAPLHFNECQVFGEHPDPVIHARMREEEAQAEKLRSYIPDGRRGRIIEIGGLAVFVDEENYDASIIAALERGDYEGPERHLVSQAVTQVDRILELGTAIGVMSMTAARIVGPENVVTFDANPDIANDARDNFRRNGLEAIRSQVGIMRNRQMITDPHETVPFYIHKVFLASRLNAWAADSNIVKTVEIPISCLEDTIADHGATVLICDIEGGEVELLGNADLSGIRLIILEAHYAEAGEAATDDLVRRLIGSGFSLDLDLSHTRYLVLRRRLSQ
jgi:FkbM family methyltransferase